MAQVEASPLSCTLTLSWRGQGVVFFVLLVLPGLTRAAGDAQPAGAAAGYAAAGYSAQAPDGTDSVTVGGEPAARTDGIRSYVRPYRSYGPPAETPGVPPDSELEASGAVIGKILIDNQNIFNLEDPKDNNWLFRLADRLHYRTRPSVIRSQLLFKPGQRYSRRLLDESERVLRADGYFYDAWIRVVSYHDGTVDVRVTTKDVWTLNPGFNFGRSGGTNSTGVELEDISFLGTGADVAVSHSSNIDRTSSSLGVGDPHIFGSWVSAGLSYSQMSDGYQREFTIQQPFYSLETRWAAGVYGIHDLQTDSLWDHGAIIDQFQDLHQGAQIYGGLSEGLQNGWVRRWSTGVTYDEHDFAPVSSWTGPTQVPEDRKFTWPWVQFDLVQDDFLKLWNHDEIARTEDFYVGTAASVRAGWADTVWGSSQSALIFQSNASKGFRQGGSTLLLFGDFSGRVTDGELRNGLLDASLRYYVEQSKNWLFFTTFVGTKGWRLDLDDQILLGGDNGLRGYPLRYQDGTERVLWTVEQRYFTDWYPFRLFRAGAAVFFDAGRVWGSAPLAPQNYGWLKDAGFGLRFGNARTGFGNVVHVDLAFPFESTTSISRVQFLVQTQKSF
jgi:surface antigen-like variable number repeat protein